MSKKKNKKANQTSAAEIPGADAPQAAADDANPADEVKGRKYTKELARLQVELAHLQAWVKSTGARVVIIFEGRDAAGKGGLIRRITERLSPRVFRVVALPAPSDRERSQIYMQR